MPRRYRDVEEEPKGEQDFGPPSEEETEWQDQEDDVQPRDDDTRSDHRSNQASSP